MKYTNMIGISLTNATQVQRQMWDRGEQIAIDVVTLREADNTKIATENHFEGSAEIRNSKKPVTFICDPSFIRTMGYVRLS